MSHSDKENQIDQVEDAEILEAEVVESKVEETASDQAEDSSELKETSDVKETGPAKKSASAILATIISLVALGAVGAGGYLAQQKLTQLEERFNQRSAAQQLEATAAVNDANAAVAELTESFQQIQAEKVAQTAEIATLQERLSDAIKQVEAGRERSESDWRLAEAEYLLRLANQRILMENRAEGALALLRSTDTILKELDDVSLYPLRQSLASDISKLESVPNLDIEGTYLRVAALIERSKDLPTLTLEQQRQLPELIDNVITEQVDAETQQNITSGFAKAISKLESLIVIQRHDQPVEPILSPDQGHYLRQNIQMLLEQAQLALLRQQQSIFTTSLSRAQSLLMQYFDKDNYTTSVLIQSLAELTTLNVSPTIPDISGSLKALQQHQKEMANLRREAE
ncbi:MULTISPECIES: uroporphyrinogen-III C-methyltransferase [unclassified Marinobacterium]|uniref:uroporphyrinogen-III C-methyltransferase n=1 Tax=unclassified Marinobacterium TaxID=2644139 RepID=UPI00156A04EC|nr:MULTISPECIES: uroporphyrinogen-III C-methyltransferase [unclassified Marinobacterium]NRP14711.1 putative uroporphyrinogen-III C-methyltransferase [Marinobacterium sp. xm-a-152]NRP38459.1 putative uroporphyrinogen-III C-methyltransferase [Marinobacterium sp. xm-a-121]NRP57973.1 putative uroporphyrinogen-III C-methyltransferase [Marinobacterium sp. xm-d-510]NRP98204.1 putative uroporphyrinogen-III C-methyltransferase [Marinobacterium sp. xm-a-127]NRQ00452.1 putative uroporphyrinogen-III C-met